jgi:hypothetical protein
VISERAVKLTTGKALGDLLRPSTEYEETEVNVDGQILDFLHQLVNPYEERTPKKIE